MKKERSVHARALSSVLRQYRNQYKIKPVWSLVGFLMPAFGTILTSFIPPLILAKIINIFIAQGSITLQALEGIARFSEAPGSLERPSGALASIIS